MLLRLLQLQLSYRFYYGRCYCHSHCCCVVVYFKLFTVASIVFANKTLLSLQRLLPHRAAIVAACLHYHCGEKNVSQQYCIYLFYCASSIMIVSLRTKAMATMMVMGTAMIYHRLFYDRDKTIVGIIFFLFLVDENGQRIC
jgi:hypothetical protein